MISTRLSILMVAMSVMGSVAPMAALADSDDGSLTAATNAIDNTAAAITGLNSIENEQTNYQESNNAVIASGECEDNDDVSECGSVSRGGGNIDVEQDAENDAENSIETGDADAEASVEAIQAALAGEFDFEFD